MAAEIVIAPYCFSDFVVFPLPLCGPAQTSGGNAGGIAVWICLFIYFFRAGAKRKLLHHSVIYIQINSIKSKAECSMRGEWG